MFSEFSPPNWQPASNAAPQPIATVRRPARDALTPNDLRVLRHRPGRVAPPAAAGSGPGAGAVGAAGPGAGPVPCGAGCPGVAAGGGGSSNELRSISDGMSGGVTPGAGCHCRYDTGVWALASVSGVS